MNTATAENKIMYTVNAQNFSKIPGSPIAYWVSQQIYNVYRNGINISNYIDSFQGIITGNNEKFLRLWYELNNKRIAFNQKKIDDVNLEITYWIPYNKGGEFRKWYGNQDYVVYWQKGADDKTRGKKQFSDYYLKEYAAWSYISMGSIAIRYYPEGFLWDVSGSGIFDKTGNLFYIQGLIGSCIGAYILNIINPTINYQVENILQMPIIIDTEYKENVDELMKSNIRTSRQDWDSFEISWDFKKHPLL